MHAPVRRYACDVCMTAGGDHRCVGDEHESNAMLRASEQKPRNSTSFWCSSSSSSSSQQQLAVDRRWMVAVVALACAVIVLMVSLTVMAVQWPETVEDVVEDRCTSASCLAAAAQIRRLMPEFSSTCRDGEARDNVSACDDTWQFSCGTWLDTHPHVPVTRSSWGLLQELDDSYERLIHTTVSSMQELRDSADYRGHVTTMYQSCHRHVDTSLKSALLQNIEKLGHFTFIQPNTKVRLVTLLSELQLQMIQVFFSMHVVSQKNGSYILQISPGELFLGDRSLYNLPENLEVLVSYRRYVVDIMHELGASSSHAMRFSDSAIGLEKRLALAMLDFCDPKTSASFSSPSSSVSFCRDSPTERQYQKLSDLSELVPLVDWVMLLRSVYPSLSVSGSTQVLVDNQQYLAFVGKVLASTPESLLNDYLMWRYVATYVPYLSRTARMSYTIFQSRVYGVIREPERWLQCARVIRHLMPISTVLMTAPSIRHARETEAAVQQLFTSLKHTVADYLDYSPLLTGTDRASVLVQMHSMRVLVNVSDTSLLTATTSAIYRRVALSPDRYVDNLHEARRLQRLTQVALLSPSEQLSHESKQMLEAALRLGSGTSLSYVTGSNTVVVPLSLLHSPTLFHHQQPAVLQYAGLGAMLTGVMLRSVHRLVWCNTPSPSSQLSLSAQASLSYCQCVESALQSQQSSLSSSRATLTDTSLTLLAFRLTLQSLQQHLKQHGDPLFAGLESCSSSKLFFIKYTQNLCSISTTAQHEMDLLTNYHQSSRVFVNFLPSQVDKFVDWFSCSSTSNNNNNNVDESFLARRNSGPRLHYCHAV